MSGSYDNPTSALDGLGYRPDVSDPIATAIGLAATAHRGQKDKAGEPYILHVLRVGLAGKSSDEQIVGFLHDALEDTDLGLSDLILYFDAHILNAICLLTREPRQSYALYIAGLFSNPLARAVKINDLRDNLSRLDKLPNDGAESLRRRYLDALKELTREP